MELSLHFTSARSSPFNAIVYMVFVLMLTSAHSYALLLFLSFSLSINSLGPFTFTYNRGHGECRNPVSNIESCTEDSRLLLNLQACPDVAGTESTGLSIEFFFFFGFSSTESHSTVVNSMQLRWSIYSGRAHLFGYVERRQFKISGWFGFTSSCRFERRTVPMLCLRKNSVKW